MRTVSCDAPHCKSTCEFPAEGVSGFVDTRTELTRRGWACRGQGPDQKHYCQAHKALAVEKTNDAAVPASQ